jgi:hypothetical protein
LISGERTTKSERRQNPRNGNGSKEKDATSDEIERNAQEIKAKFKVLKL